MTLVFLINKLPAPVYFGSSRLSDSSILFWFFSLPAPHGVACSRSMATHSRSLTTPPVSPPSVAVHRNNPPTTRLSYHRASVPCVSMTTVIPSSLSHSPFVRSSFVLPEESAADYTQVASSPIKTTVTLIRRSSDSDIDVLPKGNRAESFLRLTWDIHFFSWTVASPSERLHNMQPNCHILWLNMYRHKSYGIYITYYCAQTYDR